MIRVNQSMAGYMVPPLGFPVTLQLGGETEMRGVLSPNVDTVTVSASATKTATIYMSLSACPSTSGGADGDILSHTDSATGNVEYAQTSAALTSTEADVSLSIPEWVTARVPYVIRVWVDSITGESEDTIERSTAITDTTTQPKIPGAVSISAVKVS